MNIDAIKAKHPGPWEVLDSATIKDANGNEIDDKYVAPVFASVLNAHLFPPTRANATRPEWLAGFEAPFRGEPQSGNVYDANDRWLLAMNLALVAQFVAWLNSLEAP